MKKFTLTAIASLLMASSAFAAIDNTVYVTNKAQYEAALASCAGFTNEDRLTIVVCKSLNENGDGEGQVADNTVVINSNYTLKHNRGTVILRSNQTDIDNLPQMQLGVNGMEHAADSKFSWICENISLQYRAGKTASSGQIFYWQKMSCDKMQLDSIIFRNCEITNIPRTLFRTAPSATTDAEGKPLSPSKIQYLEMTGCKVHDMNITKGNNWALFVIGSMPVEMKFSNNMFYDMPYSKGIIQMAYVTNDGTSPKIWFNNNTVMMAKAKYGITPAVMYTQAEADSINAANAAAIEAGEMAAITTETVKTPEAYSNNGCCLFNMGGYLSASTEYYLYNNIFMAQKQGVVAKPTDYADYTIMDGEVDVLYARAKVDEVWTTFGYLTASNNYTDGAYKSMDRGAQDDLIENPIEKEFDWTSFFKPDMSNFISLKDNPFYTAGASSMSLDLEGQQTTEIPSCVGASQMYVDEFPAEAKVTTAVAGEYYGTPVISITPAKEIYKKGDKVTVSVADAASTALRQFNVFKGWSGSSTSTEKSFEYEFTEAGEYTFTANFEKNANAGNVLAAWYSATGKDMSNIEAQIGAGTLMAFGADTTGVNKVLQTAELPYIGKAFQTRTNKFGEDPVAQQVCTYNLRTSAASRDYNRDYAVIKLNTTGKIDVIAKFYRGTDSNASKIQNTYWSTDSVNWTLLESATLSLDSVARPAKFGEKEGQLFGWTEVTAALPSACDGKEAVYVKIQGAVKGAVETEDDLVYNKAGFADFEAVRNSDVFEYISNILVTATDFDVTPLENAIKVAKDTIQGTPITKEKALKVLQDAIAVAEKALTTVSNSTEVNAAVSALNLAIKEAVLIYNLTPYEVKESIVLDVNPTVFEDYKAAGWMSHTEATPGSSAKKGTITPKVDGDVTVAATNFTGINTKEGNRNSYMAVTGVTSISAYFNYNKGNVGTLDVYGTEITATYAAPANNTTGVATLENLDASETYYIRVHANADLGWYAVKFIAGSAAGNGDANGDGTVSVADLSLMATYILTGEAEGINLKNADVNGDGEVSVADLSAVAAKILAAEARKNRLAL